MAIPTSRFPTWATDGGADVTDPGSSKQATGWVEGEAPAADHTNWLHNARGEWLDFIWRSTLPTVIGTNLVDKNTSPFGTDVFNITLVWEPTQDKFYASVVETASTDWIAYESTDGITWSGGTTVDVSYLGTPAPAEIAYCPDNSKIGAVTDAGFHLSSSNSVSGFSTTPTGTTGFTSGATGLVWDDTNNLWIACGTLTGTDGYIKTAAAAGVTWTQRDTEASAVPLSIAHDRAGQTVVVYGGTDLIQYSSNGTTWTRQTTGMSKVFTDAWWCPFASVFVAATDALYWSADGDVWALCPFGAVDEVIVCEDFLLFIDGTSKELHYVGSVDAIKGDAPYISVGADMSSDDLNPFNGLRTWTGSGTAFSYYNVNETLVNCTFR
jgi:hypothetical protein